MDEEKAVTVTIRKTAVTGDTLFQVDTKYRVPSIQMWIVKKDNAKKTAEIIQRNMENLFKELGYVG